MEYLLSELTNGQRSDSHHNIVNGIHHNLRSTPLGRLRKAIGAFIEWFKFENFLKTPGSSPFLNKHREDFVKTNLMRLRGRLCFLMVNQTSCFIMLTTKAKGFIVKRMESVAALLILIFSVGCGGAPQDAPMTALHAFSGVVEVDGKPAGGAHVALHPVDNSGLGVVTPNGVTDENGLFFLTTYSPSDGAPEGKYKVTVSWADVENPGASDPDYGPEKLPSKYQDKGTSPLEVEIKPEMTASEVLELSTR